MRIAFLTCLLASAAVSAAGTGYLPDVGPVPIRFQTPSPPAPLFHWPPLVVLQTPAVKADAPATNAPVVEEVRTAPSTNILASPPVAITSPSASPPPAAPVIPFGLPAPTPALQPTEGPVDPQVLLNYLFSASTNDPGTRIVMPVFIPPPPPAAFPSSHATYESP